mmetsp:Transcript_56917/g.106945  ORF Transcript_56917/g.106945 Transcript_56917/m.106945 type:complete len:208 (-) Transcript_56917:378-1001(-)
MPSPWFSSCCHPCCSSCSRRFRSNPLAPSASAAAASAAAALFDEVVKGDESSRFRKLPPEPISDCWEAAVGSPSLSRDARKGDESIATASPSSPQRGGGGEGGGGGGGGAITRTSSARKYPIGWPTKLRTTSSSSPLVAALVAAEEVSLVSLAVAEARRLLAPPKDKNDEGGKGSGGGGSGDGDGGADDERGGDDESGGDVLACRDC